METFSEAKKQSDAFHLMHGYQIVYFEGKKLYCCKIGFLKCNKSHKWFRNIMHMIDPISINTHLECKCNSIISVL